MKIKAKIKIPINDISYPNSNYPTSEIKECEIEIDENEVLREIQALILNRSIAINTKEVNTNV